MPDNALLGIGLVTESFYHPSPHWDVMVLQAGAIQGYGLMEETADFVVILDCGTMIPLDLFCLMGNNAYM